MDSFNNYGRNDLSEMYPSFIYLNEDENSHLLLDMDSLVSRRSNFLANRSCESVKKKCFLVVGGDFSGLLNIDVLHRFMEKPHLTLAFNHSISKKTRYTRYSTDPTLKISEWIGDEECKEIDGTGWSDKPIKNWCQEETINWLMSAASYMGQPYSSIQHSLAVSGKELVTFTRQDFINYDPIYGDQLYDLLHSQRVSNLHAESDNSVEVATKRMPGRPRVLKTKKNPVSQGKLWEFIRDLLRNRETCPSLICWEDYSQAKFRFVKSDEVAKRWGSRKGNTKMTYEKLSRAMRYYYKSKIFLPVLGRRLVYQFGPNAKGWQTDNPNFRN
ncbi:ETS-related transcription factor Elf-5-like isoform X4 [Formica exsecta]|uniref:ETS-related transcription factor Elf-5-like isoform X4 n=1 Tax=Formica exsecta TaxID=72781 RepID=UPI001142253A|nr:ETS-related transcription factor Elf-5-like isoform X4 [Formica exsecta]